MYKRQLENNRDYKRRVASYKINWVDEEEMIRKFYNQMREDEAYIAYMNKPEVSYADEKQLVEMVLLRLFSESEYLRSYFDERNIFWSEEFDIAVMMVDKTIKGYRETADEFTSLPTLLKDENPVSYTHLDVYKRQSLYTLSGGSFPVSINE